MTFKSAAAAIAILIAGAGAPADAQTSPEGIWLTASRNLEIEIGPCGQGLCGSVVRVLANNAMTGGGKSPAPPAALGARLITNLHRSGGEWRGRIFNRENGRTYDCVVRPLADGSLEVRPYVLLPAFGQTQIWRRAGLAHENSRPKSNFPSR